MLRGLSRQPSNPIDHSICLAVDMPHHPMNESIQVVMIAHNDALHADCHSIPPKFEQTNCSQTKQLVPSSSRAQFLAHRSHTINVTIRSILRLALKIPDVQSLHSQLCYLRHAYTLLPFGSRTNRM